MRNEFGKNHAAEDSPIPCAEQIGYLFQLRVEFLQDQLNATRHKRYLCYAKFNTAINSGDYNNFFEDGSFDEQKAQTIATAQVGQIISPEITSKIGKDHGADYLIHGTIINLGTGDWLNENLEFISGAVTQYASVAAAYGSNVLGVLGNFGTIEVQTKGIGVQCDVRVIKAQTGEVIWSKRVTGVAEQSLIGIGPIVFGHTNVSYSLYQKAIDKAVDKISKALIEETAGKIF